MMNESTNTFKTLKGEKRLVTRLWCYMGIHNWEKYSDPQEEFENGRVYKHTYLTRTCDGCKLVQIKTLRRA